ncbi:MAG: phosphoribosyltransferase domain-containing protein [Pseudomonadota bacterium]|nr:phosphoribosyltransferase domain-containing protein [Pseudomonadota bacterium]
MNPPEETRTVRLSTGTLELRVRSADLPLDTLCAFGARRNPKRGFLFVSRVLGRHIPARPSVMRDVHVRLAAKLPADLPGPVVFVGLAETAVALGRGVFEEWCAASSRAGLPRTDALFLQTTRAATRFPVAFTFEEPHSHASRHLVWEPADAEDRALLEAARTLVIVDDEVTTGTTLANLAEAWARRFPAVTDVRAVVITDWRAPRDPAEGEHVGLPFVSLLEGSYTFVPGESAPPAPSATGDDRPKDHLLPSRSARTGARPGASWLPTLPDPRTGERILVLGTGEFTWEAFRVGLALESRGADVACQSTTRSPALVDADLRACLTFDDNYGDGIPHYLYNVRAVGDAGGEDAAPGEGGIAWERVLVCHETPASTLSPKLLGALRAEALDFHGAAHLDRPAGPLPDRRPDAPDPLSRPR